jgi:two-component system sensor histidine kinase RegB
MVDLFIASIGSEGSVQIGQGVGHKNMLQLIQLRWIAVAGQITTIAVAILGLGISLPLPHMLQVLICLIAFNIGSHLRWHERPVVTNNELFLALVVDVATFTVLLYLTGGTANPFAFLYLLQVILSAVLLEAWSTWIIVAITSACLAGLSMWSHPLQLPLDDTNGLSNLYTDGLLICFALNAALLVFFITRINGNQRAADAQLAGMRQQAIEEDHIVRIGLLASGAAHELGTPLATLSVILGDWKRLPELGGNRELQEEIGEMETQLSRCKSILSGILLAAGEARGESSAKTTINTFLNGLAHEWSGTRPIASFIYENHIIEDEAVVFDSALKQMIGNVLDNAFDASPDWVRLDARCEAKELILEVTDKGDGFSDAILAQFGKPYQSSKGRPGGGLGLFFAVNVARKLGGAVKAHNKQEGGAAVRISFPLSAISLEKPADDLPN